MSKIKLSTSKEILKMRSRLFQERIIVLNRYAYKGELSKEEYLEMRGKVEEEKRQAEQRLADFEK